MTKKEKDEKIQKVENEINSVKNKIASLSLHLDNLNLRLERLNEIEAQELKVLTDEEKKDQSRKDRKKHADAVAERIKEITFD